MVALFCLRVFVPVRSAGDLRYSAEAWPFVPPWVSTKLSIVPHHGPSNDTQNLLRVSLTRKRVCATLTIVESFFFFRACTFPGTVPGFDTTATSHHVSMQKHVIFSSLQFSLVLVRPLICIG